LRLRNFTFTALPDVRKGMQPVKTGIKPFKGQPVNPEKPRKMATKKSHVYICYQDSGYL